MKITKFLSLLLLSLVVLGACSNTEKRTTQTSKSKTAQNSKLKDDIKQSSADSTTPEVSAPASQVENTATEHDLDIDAINHGDITTLIGTWQNGRGETLAIAADGTCIYTSSDGDIVSHYKIQTVPDSDKTSKIPYADIKFESVGGAALGLYKIGFSNPDGDQSDISKPRVSISQSAGDYPADAYFYRLN